MTCALLHCSGSSYTVLLGAHNRNSPQKHEQKIKGKRVIVHPQYGRPLLSNDIALIQLERPATISNRVSTVCLPSHNYALPLSSTCYITGKNVRGCSMNVCQAQINLRKTISEPQTGVKLCQPSADS